MSSPRTIKEGWNDFRDQCLPLSASPGQVEDMRCAFIGGAGSMFGMITTVGPDESDEAVMARLAGFRAEFEAHAAALEKRGKG